MSEHAATEKDATYSCCRHCMHQALDRQRGGHSRPCEECQRPRVTPPTEDQR